MSRTYNAGIVTAYGAAVRGGYTGTYEEFCAEQAGFAENASAVAQAKTDAQQSANSASGSAQTATAQAGLAQGYANNASGSATNAQQSANNAQQSANNASTYAGNAQQYANSASGYADNAERSAQDAQQILDSIPADYSQLSADVSNIKADLLSVYATDTASGAIATFTDGADDIPVKSLVVNIEPVQSGSGDPSFTNVRPITGHTGSNITANTDTIAVDWTSEAGTVYKGSLNVTTGVLSVTGMLLQPTAINGIIQHSSGVYYCTVSGVNAKTGGDTMSDMFKVVSNVTEGEGGYYITANGSTLVFVLPQTITTKEDADAWLVANAPTFICERDTPQTYQLTAQYVNSILGSNSFSADCGDVSVTYRADTTLFVNRKITEAISALS